MDPSPTPASDPEAWVALHGDALFRYARSRISDVVTAEDIVQETFLAALAARQEFRGESAERTWLIGILRHKLIDHLRRRSREQPLEVNQEGDTVVDAMFSWGGVWRKEPAMWSVEPAELSDKQAFWAAFELCRDALPTRQAAVFTLRMLEGVEAEVVCKELGMTSTNLWVLLHRARIRLRSCLESHWFGKEGSSS